MKSVKQGKRVLLQRRLPIVKEASSYKPRSMQKMPPRGSRQQLRLTGDVRR